MSLKTDLEEAVAQAREDADIMRAIVQGPATGETSLVATESGDVKTFARTLAEIEEAFEAMMTEAWDNVVVAASSTDFVLENVNGEGGAGDRCLMAWCIPTDASIGEISIKDGESGDPIVLHEAKTRTNDDPFPIPVRLRAETGPLMVSVGANVSVNFIGDFGGNAS